MHRIGVFILRSVKWIEPPAGRSTALVFRFADQGFTLHIVKKHGSETAASHESTGGP
jgi:hypothetical protein